MAVNADMLGSVRTSNKVEKVPDWKTAERVRQQKTITSLSKSSDWSHFITGSLDKSAKLWDRRTLTLIKTYVKERPVNDVDISPTHDTFCFEFACRAISGEDGYLRLHHLDSDFFNIKISIKKMLQANPSFII
ncbi:hypothetical protein EJB05_26855, partial [Eragrostis curvula]